MNKEEVQNLLGKLIHCAVSGAILELGGEHAESIEMLKRGGLLQRDIIAALTAEPALPPCCTETTCNHGCCDDCGNLHIKCDVCFHGNGSEGCQFKPATPMPKPESIKDGGLKMKYIILHAEDGRPVGSGRRFVLNIDSKDEAYGRASRLAKP